MRWEMWRKLDYFRIVQKELIWTDEVYDMWHNKVLRNKRMPDMTGIQGWELSNQENLSSELH